MYDYNIISLTKVMYDYIFCALYNDIILTDMIFYTSKLQNHGRFKHTVDKIRYRVATPYKYLKCTTNPTFIIKLHEYCHILHKSSYL